MVIKQPARTGSRSKRKKKGIQYKKVGFKLTVGQKKALERFCKMNKLTPVRFMKSLVNNYVARYREEPHPPSYVTKNQLKLFDQEK